MAYLAFAPLVAALLQAPAPASTPRSVASANHSARASRPVETVVPNDNRRPGGTLEGGVLRLRLVAGLATWRPNDHVDSTVTVLAFSEEGGAPRIPGPLVRAEQGTEVRISLRNALPDTTSTLVVHGLRAGSFADDTVHLAPGQTREVSFTAGAPGTFVYWGTTTRSPIFDRPVRDGQLTGAIVVDPKGVRPDTAERVFVMTVVDLFPDDTARNRKKEDVFDRAINGRSWPYTERMKYAVGDTVKWRWVNGSYLPHPMHLHGFHFEVLARGEKNADTTYAPGRERTVVTEFMVAGSTFRMRWVPTRAGHWLMHCHMLPHITPWPARPDTVRAHDSHDVARHPLDAMQGLVLGVEVAERPGAAVAAAPPAPTRRLRVLAQEARADSGRPAPRGYVLQTGTEPRADSVEVPGSPLVLVRGETTAITVVNRLPEPTTVHWHGMELESVFDGVSGWSRSGSSMAPLVAPGDSFTVTFTPPRAGTFMYHTHMDEGAELMRGMYGPLVVLEPGQRWDPATDLVFMFGGAVERDSLRNVTINARREPAPRELRVGTRYRLRLANIHAAGGAVVSLRAPDSALLSWRPLAKDGADIPDHLRSAAPSRIARFGTGETWDLEWTPDREMDAVMYVELEGSTRRQVFRVRAASAEGRGASERTHSPLPTPHSQLPRVLPNDNRVPAGRTVNGERVLRLEARMGMWRPGGEARPGLAWPAFAEEGGAPTIPGPLVRLRTGTVVRATIRNRLDRPISVLGLGRTRGAAGDSLVIAPGAVAETRFVAGEPGLHYYVARTQPAWYPRGELEGSLHGVIAIDPANAPAEPADRIFVISGAGFEDSTTVSGLTPETALTINGLEWPITERFHVAQGDTLRWRWVNMTDLDHPMHLHGFHFRVDARGDGRRDTLYDAARRWHAVTELVRPGATLATTWSPERPGNWIFHCHLASHMTPQRVLDMPYAERGAAHGGHGADSADGGHTKHEMAGLVIGIHVRPKAGAGPAPVAREVRTLRLLVRSRPRVYGENAGYAYVLGGSTEERDDAALPVPGPTLVLTKDEPVAVTIVNRAHEPAAIHWHGIELESFPDGVPGWSGEGSNVLPAVAPGDSLTVRFTPPRAGTFMYHSHFNEMQQIASGMYGAIVVLEPGQRWDPEIDRVLVFGDEGPFLNFARDPAQPILLNGSASPPPMELRAGTTYRLRLINIRSEFDANVALLDGDTPVTWRLVAKDGATLPAHLATERPAELRFFPGEIHDYEFTPARAGELALRFWKPGRKRVDTRVPVRVLAASRSDAQDSRSPLRTPHSRAVQKIEHFFASAPDAERLFGFFRDTLGLAEVWAYQSWPGFASGGVSLGNVAFELVWWKTDDGKPLATEFAGIAFEPPGTTDALLAELRRRGIPHDRPDSNAHVNASGRRVGWVNTGLPALARWNVFVCDYLARQLVADNRRVASEALARAGGGPLGVVALREIVLGASDVEGAMREWRRMIDSPAQEAGGVFSFGDGPRLRVERADSAGIRGIVIEVRSLERARALLAGKGMLGADDGRSVAVAPARVGGLRITLVERDS